MQNVASDSELCLVLPSSALDRQLMSNPPDECHTVASLGGSLAWSNLNNFRELSSALNLPFALRLTTNPITRKSIL
jgi:hypothetical protein